MLNIVATVVLLPVALIFPGGLLSFLAVWKSAIVGGTQEGHLAMMLLTSGFYYFMYQVLSFLVLSCVQPITHSVLNTVKRVVIILVSILVFQNPVTAQGVLGTVMAIGSVFFYVGVKNHDFGRRERSQI